MRGRVRKPVLRRLQRSAFALFRLAANGRSSKPLSLRDCSEPAAQARVALAHGIGQPIQTLGARSASKDKVDAAVSPFHRSSGNPDPRQNCYCENIIYIQRGQIVSNCPTCGIADRYFVTGSIAKVNASAITLPCAGNRARSSCFSPSTVNSPVQRTPRRSFCRNKWMGCLRSGIGT